MMMNLMYTLIHAEIHDDHGERVTVPQRRTGWLDRELDYETAPGHVPHKLYDLDHRKYDAATAQFLSVDPLWPMFISSGSYVYCTGDAVNKIDPWGLGEVPQDIMPPKRQPSKPLVPFSPMVTGHDESTTETNRVEALALLRDQFQISAMIYSLMRNKEQMLSGIGPGGKGGVGYWSGRGATPETAVQLKGVTVSATRIRGFSVGSPTTHTEQRTMSETIVRAATGSLSVVNGTTSGLVESATQNSGTILKLNPGLAKYVKVSKILGGLGLLAEGYYNGRRLAAQPSIGNTVRFLVPVAATAAAFIPVIGWAISATITTVDFVWGDQIYQVIDDEVAGQ
jgi:RHS repeat-associated protein